MKKLMYVLVGFVSGIVYVSCSPSVSNSIAQAVSSAAQISFSSSSSHLTATTVQGALDAVAPSDEALTTELVGTWSGTVYSNEEDEDSDISFTLSDNGTYTCASSGNFINSSNCTGNLAWRVTNGILFLIKDAGSEIRLVYPIVRLTGSALTLGVSNNSRIAILAKN